MTAPRITLTDEERQILIDMRLAGKTQAQIEKRIGVHILVIRREMRALGLPMRLSRPWSPDEEAKLQAMEWPVRVPVLLATFPGRSRAAIVSKASSLGIPARIDTGFVPYSDAENTIIRQNFGRIGVRQWAHLLPGRNVGAIMNHAHVLGLRSDLQRATRFTENQTFKRHRKSKRRSVIRTTSHTDSSPIPG